MTRASMWLHIGLCVAALALAWRAAHTVRERTGPSSTTLLPGDVGDVVAVDYVWEKGATHVERRGPQVVVALDREAPTTPARQDGKDANKKADEKLDTATDPRGAPDAGPSSEFRPEVPGGPTLASMGDKPSTAPREQARFPGGRAVQSALKALEPLHTKRTLGTVDDTRLAAMGFSPPTRTMTVTTKNGRTLVLELGDSSYGAQGRYARVKGDTVVHLIDAAIASGLEGGVDQLLEKQPVTVELEQVRGYALKAGERTAVFVHVAREQPGKRFFARRDEESTKDEAGTKLFGTLRNLRGTKLASDAVVAAGGAVVASIAVDSDEDFTLELVERADGGGHVARVKPWAWEVSPTQAKEFLDDVDAVLAP